MGEEEEVELTPLEDEANLIVQTDNGPRPEDGEQPPQDAEPVFEEDDA